MPSHSLWKNAKLRTCTTWFLALVILGFAINNWFHTAREIVRDYCALPAEDYWRVVLDLKGFENLDFGVLWRQHNEHRIIFPEIMFLIDMVSFHGLEILPLVVSFLCYLATCLVFARALFREMKSPLSVRLIAMFAVAFLIGWPGSSAVLSSAFLLQWTFVQLAAIASLYLISRAAETQKTGDFWAAIAAAIVATFSSGNGLVLWPVLWIGGFIMSLGWRRMILLSAAAVVCIAAFFYRYQPSTDSHPANIIHNPLYFLGFLASYFSMPFGAIKGPHFGVFIGAAYLLALAGIVIGAVHSRSIRSVPFITLCGFIFFVFLGTVLTAVGRMAPGDRNFVAAKQARYVTMPILSWAALILLLLWLSDRLSWRVFSPARIAFLVTVFLILFFPRLRPWIRSVENDFAEIQLVALSIESAVADPATIQKDFPSPELVLASLPELRANHLSIFYDGWSNLLGQPIASHFVFISRNAKTSAVTRIWPVVSGLEIAGYDITSEKPADRMIILDESGKIAGFGRKFPVMLPREISISRMYSGSGWAGFVNLALGGGKHFSAYEVEPHQQLRPLGEPFSAPPIEAVTAGNAATPIAGVTWGNDKIWTEHGIPPSLNTGRVAPERFLASWSGWDGNRGRAQSSAFSVPGKGCFILPVLHGPSVDGLSVNIVNAATGTLIAGVPLQDADTQWRYWRVSVGPDVDRVQIMAVDNGPSWGQWLAVGQPEQCR